MGPLIGVLFLCYNAIMIKEFDYVNRECGSCTACCEGWVSGEAYGEPFYTGRHCHFLDKGCTIYQDRPSACAAFKCAWIESQQIPNWMKPEYSKVILYNKHEGDMKWLCMVEMGSKVDSSVLVWVLEYARTLDTNLYYEVDKIPHLIGSPQFIRFMNLNSQ